MKLKKKEKKFIKIFSSKIFLFFLILILAGFSKVCLDKFFEVQEARKIVLEGEEKIKGIELKSKKLEVELKKLQDKKHLENITKEKLNLARPGEKVIYVLPEEEEKTGEKKTGEKGFWEQLMEIFKGEGDGNEKAED